VPAEVLEQTEAALSLAILSYNLTQLFQRHLGWLDRVTRPPAFRLFTTAASSASGRDDNDRLAVAGTPRNGLVADFIGEDHQPDPTAMQ